MTTGPGSKVLVVNFNAPELNHLAQTLAGAGQLSSYVRPYVNKGRWWERSLAAMPLGGRLYSSTFGRRQIDHPALASLTNEAGCFSDIASAVIGRTTLLPDHTRHRWTNGLRKDLREAVANKGGALVQADQCVVAYEGFALPAFKALRAAGGGRALLNYPVAHHRQRRKIRDEEARLEPGFAITWPGFDDWGARHEERLDQEIDMADVVLVGSQFVADSFVAEGIPPQKLRVVPYGVDLKLFSPAALPVPHRPFQVVYAGQLTQRKGLSYLLRAYQDFVRADSQLTLVGSVVGSREPLAPFAHLFNHVPHQTRPALAQRYRQAHVFVLPTLVEGMPLVVLEAMACGLPVIVTANGPAGIVRDGVDGFIVPQRDVLAIVEKLNLLYEQPELQKQMGHNAAQRAREFSWHAYGRGVQQVLQEFRAAP